ncbi:MAG: hypothetical protein H7Y04_03255 [Verrucomicrobia bacterium]|nr:hypothetical protein [Cytophagales bacterium]
MADTVDNWQVYVDKHMVFAGNIAHEIQDFNEITININRKNQLIELKYNTCTHTNDRQQIIITDNRFKRLLQKTFGAEEVIRFSVDELRKLEREEIILFYRKEQMFREYEGQPLAKLKFTK